MLGYSLECGFSRVRILKQFYFDDEPVGVRNCPTMPVAVQIEWEERHGSSKNAHPSRTCTGVGGKDMNTGRITRSFEVCGVIF